MDFRFWLAFLTGKLTAALIRIKGGGATAAPGLYALKIDPDFVKKLSRQIRHGSIVISGTNGKTTTSRLISSLLSKKFQIIHNRQGSNLLRGIASTLISNTTNFAKVKGDFGIWEVDEAALPETLENLNPSVILLLNLFRDQLDRYGEVDTVRQKWQKALEKLNKNTVLVLNTDDPGISFLKEFFPGKIIFFGVEEESLNMPATENVADVKNCLSCQTKLEYSVLYSAHLGHYACPNCKLNRPRPNISAKNIKFKEGFKTVLDLSANEKSLNFEYNLPGLYNVYNILAAASAVSYFDISQKEIATGIKSFKSAFGRFQKIQIQNKKIVLFLIKNPAGANEIIRILKNGKNLELLAMLNDNFADGRDVSWIWNTAWEELSNSFEKINISGTKAWDLATRLKYSDFKLSKEDVYKDINYSVANAIEKLHTKNTLIILPTYTALLKVQRTLNKITKTTKWHED